RLGEAPITGVTSPDPTQLQAGPTRFENMGSPVLTDDPYNPNAVQARVRPDYIPNPAHDPTSPRFNPTKTPEPTDAAPVYAGAVRTDMGVWFGRGQKGWYRYFYDRMGVHFSGIVSEHDVPISVRRSYGGR